MNHFDTLTIDTLLLRFPRIAQDIFKELDNKSLIKLIDTNRMIAPL